MILSPSLAVQSVRTDIGHLESHCPCKENRQCAFKAGLSEAGPKRGWRRSWSWLVRAKTHRTRYRARVDSRTSLDRALADRMDNLQIAGDTPDARTGLIKATPGSYYGFQILSR
jgi:hypothetical protein